MNSNRIFSLLEFDWLIGIFIMRGISIYFGEAPIPFQAKKGKAQSVKE